MVKKAAEGARRGRVSEGAETRARMVTAAFATLVGNGYAQTTARAIATRGGFNSALIFYHYEGVDQLLLAALDQSTEERLGRYRQELSEDLPPAQLARKARELFEQDVADGHVTAVTELTAASIARPELRAELISRMHPWLALSRDVVGRVLESAGLELSDSTAETLSFAIVSLYLGLDVMSRLEPDLSRTGELFAIAESLARVLDGPLG